MHAMQKFFLAYARHAGPVHLGFHASKNELENILEVDDNFLKFAEGCKRVDNPSKCLREFSLDNHPTIAHLIHEVGVRNRRELGRTARAEVIKVLYHLDRTTLYQERPASSELTGNSPPTFPERAWRVFWANAAVTIRSRMK